MNMYGVHPAMTPGLLSGNINLQGMMNGGITYPDKHKQLGFLTDQMIKVSSFDQRTINRILYACWKC